ncbi:serine/threonine-protein kinase [Kutzneria buriramensis]|uniref:Serine/threonine protein kinase n=1 Tax=Kutzneria buriramensis TaxID=1045776 RepID=A0A3E0GVL0_9PSEU|nr:serine/threonine-protein kinase [Kutzneria buriramensis]REH27704.1 serine/threonine protein kinase [Kutzneria buriramensis]
MRPLEPTDPQSVGRYRLEARLGSGGFGDVYLGRTPGGRLVAVKCVRERVDDPQLRQRFAAEMEAARRVGGFHTAQVVDADAEATPPYLVTAYIPGPTLAQVIAEHGRLPEPSLRVLGAGLAEALEAIHSAGLIHRDLKPSNVLIAHDGPRVIDFGIARALDGTALTGTGSVLGTPTFMAPEQARGLALTPACDVFNLGLVLCHAAASPPFGEGSTAALIYRVVHEEPDVGTLPAVLQGPVAACLAKDPAQRPSPAELLAIFGGSTPHVSWLPPEVRTMVPQPARTGAETATTGPHHQPLMPAPTPPLSQVPLPVRGSRRSGVIGALVATVLGLAAATIVTVVAVNSLPGGAPAATNKTVATVGPTGSETGGHTTPTGSETGGHTTTPAPPLSATIAGTWSADNGPLTVTIVKVVDNGGRVSLTVSAHNGATQAVNLPSFGYFTATDDQGTSYTAGPGTVITAPAGGTVSDTLTLEKSVPASARSLNIAWAQVFSLDLAVHGSISITGVPLPR